VGTVALLPPFPLRYTPFPLSGSQRSGAFYFTYFELDFFLFPLFRRIFAFFF
jgi:hypothetical protein